MKLSWRRLTAIVSLLFGAGLLAVALRRIDVRTFAQLSRLFGVGLPLALLPGSAWHFLRTEAWRRCFPADLKIRFATIFRVRLSAEAFSYLTIAGVTGEPLKVVLLADAVPPPICAAAIAVERAAYMIVTAAIVAVAAAATAWAMPLTPRWARVYTWIAAVAALIAILPLALVLRQRKKAEAPTIPEPAFAPTGARRFLRRFAEHLRTFARSDPRQLGIVVALEAAAFLMMALEVFAALSLTGTPVTLPAAIAIETFTRVASIATAFIPGNLGTLEISNVAATAAVHAASGGLALALLRRFRGLAWCAAGILVYPGGWRRGDRGTSRSDRASNDAASTLVAVQHADSDAMVTESLGGMPVGERMARAAVRAGYTRLVVWTSRQREAGWLSAVARLAGRLEIVVVSDSGRWRDLWRTADPRAVVTVLAPGIVASPQILSAARDLVATRDQLTEAPAGAAAPASGVFRATVRDVVAVDGLAPRLAALTRRLQPPPSGEVANGTASLTVRVATSDALGHAERMLRASIFKPTDGPLGRFNRRLSIPISIAFIQHARLSAHVMSVFVIVLGLYAGWLFSRGSYVTGLAAALISWAASVLDGCDGELARLQFKESAFGCWVDTLGDYVYYIAIFAGLTVGAVRQTGWLALWWCGAALGVGVLLTFALLILLRWRITGGRPERLRTRTSEHFYGMGKPWARLVAKLSNCATRATMPYGIVGFAVFGLLPVVVVLATIGAQVYWISLAREFRRLVNDRPRADGHLARSAA